MTRPDLYARGHETDTLDGGDKDDLPVFGLEYNFDELQRPSEVTVFDPSTSNWDTEWLTAPIEAAVPVEECR